MRFITVIWDLLLKRYPNQFNKLNLSFLSDILVLTATDTEYLGNLKPTTTDLATTEKLAAGCHFAIAGVALEVARVPLDLAGLPIPAMAHWVNYASEDIFVAADERAQVHQIFNGEIELWRDATQIPLTLSNSQFLNDGPLSGMAVGNFDAFTPELHKYILNGDTDSAYVVKVKLPEGSVQDKLVGTDYAILVRPRFVGVEIKGLCAEGTDLNMIPSDCNGANAVDCTCPETTASNSVDTAISKVKMIENPNKDLGYLYWTLD